jgi:hypothetical protein
MPSFSAGCTVNRFDVPVKADASSSSERFRTLLGG